MAKKIYWAICILAFLLSAYFAPQFVNYEWGVGAYIAIGWGTFLVVFGLVAIFSENIKQYFDGKK